jgi:allantoin racemase
MKLLVVNPNTTQAVTESLAGRVRAVVGAAVDIEAITARFGAAYIASEASCAIAAHAALEACHAHCETHGRPDAIIVGCFGDPGVFALRESFTVPVVGLAEAAMREAARHGRYAIVTGGAAWRPMLLRLARTLELSDRLTNVAIVAPTGAELAADRERAIATLGEACVRAAAGSDAVVLGGAGLAGMAEEIALATTPRLSIPLIDSVDAAARAALASLR